jgi:hypothetical protein
MTKPADRRAFLLANAFSPRHARLENADRSPFKGNENIHSFRRYLHSQILANYFILMVTVLSVIVARVNLRALLQYISRLGNLF